MMGKLGDQDAAETTVREMVIEGVLSIQAGDNPRILQMKLSSYLSPAQQKQLAESHPQRRPAEGRRRRGQEEERAEPRRRSASGSSPTATWSPSCSASSWPCSTSSDADGPVRRSSSPASTTSAWAAPRAATRSPRASSPSSGIPSAPSRPWRRAGASATRQKKAMSLFQPEIKSNKVRITDGRARPRHLPGLGRLLQAGQRRREHRGDPRRLHTPRRVPASAGHRRAANSGSRGIPTPRPPIPRAPGARTGSSRPPGPSTSCTSSSISACRSGASRWPASRIPCPSPRTTPRKGRAYNRRVDIIVLDEGHL